MLIQERITGKTRLAAVIGNPVQHSISPQLHNTLINLTGADLVYVAIKVENSSLKAAVDGFRAMGLIGFNVTAPHKTEIVKYLDELSEEARVTGAVNTVKMENGLLKGYNTDGEGFLRAFAQETGTEFTGKTVVILGAGGAARAIAYRIAAEGPGCMFILNRTLEKAQLLSRLISEKTGINARSGNIDGQEATRILSRCDIIINTTSLGMYPHASLMPVNDSVVFSGGQVVCDIIYNPPQTPLLKKAKQAGCITANGVSMLIHQGIASYEKWTGTSISQETCRRLAAEFKKYMDK